MDSAVQGYHVYKDVWKPAIGKKLHAKQEPDNGRQICHEGSKKQREIPCI